MNGFISSEIDISLTSPVRQTLLQQRRTELYGLLALHRSPTDANATTKISNPTLAASGQNWVTPGNQFVVVTTSIGRIGLTLGEELAVSEVFGHLSAQRADIIAAPARQLDGLTLQVDPKLFVVPHPANTPFEPYAAAKLSQTWLVTAGWTGTNPSTWVFGPEPIIKTAPVRNVQGQNRVELNVSTPYAGTWINQQQLIAGQLPYSTIPLVLDPKGECFTKWSQSPGWQRVCW